ncbi:Dienelactone hydrolase family protein [Flaviramulus basaltis]|uniref:Dienelactone hydrolase family protein n=1 Tax=Flaviramulus basaltis TaxID=369401 RepID=A0A1K2IH51_9FLAO|nr:dienelactone hydrolase family protein [Flaviramulus basaltis]SFZ90995.1 Dienelactone hydrolase family protein [Flaviramulus basaltis]
MKTFTYLIILLPCLFLSCSSDDLDSKQNQNDLEFLPEDTGGMQKANILGATNAVFGHYIYTPSNYNNNSPKYPLLVFLHGSGERGNSETNPDILNKVLANGPPKLIEKEEWHPKYPMIVASPQLPSGNWNPDDIHSFITYLIANYNINIERIYVTGLSLGGFGSFSYISTYGFDSYAAAIVPIAGGGSTNSGNKFTTTPVWAFHGDNDTTVSHNQSINMINAINEANPETRAKLTIYPGVSHNSWSRTYDSSGMGDESSDYDAFNMTIYDWMFMHKKSE